VITFCFVGGDCVRRDERLTSDARAARPATGATKTKKTKTKKKTKKRGRVFCFVKFAVVELVPIP
jgi:hypothetical protein